jgi:hypothetical protein
MLVMRVAARIHGPLYQTFAVEFIGKTSVILASYRDESTSAEVHAAGAAFEGPWDELTGTARGLSYSISLRTQWSRVRNYWPALMHGTTVGRERSTMQ